MAHPRQIIEYSKISDYIYVGTNMCCSYHFRNLMRLGLVADIDLESVRLEKPKGLDIFLWLPTKDHHAPTQAQLLAGATMLDTLAGSKMKVYVHCQKGHGRAPTLVAAYYILKGKKVSDAIKILKHKRPVIHLNEIQVKALKKFEASL